MSDRETGIPCLECGQRSGIDCPGRQLDEVTRCRTCLDKYIKEELEWARQMKLAEQVMDENDELLRRLAE